MVDAKNKETERIVNESIDPISHGDVGEEKEALQWTSNLSDVFVEPQPVASA